MKAHPVLAVSSALLWVVAASLSSACGSQGEPTVVPEALGAPSATPTAAVAPSATPSAEELALLDAIANALRSGDPEALRPRIGYTPVGCSARPAQDVGGPPVCAAGEEDGRQVDVFLLTACEGEYLRPSTIDRALDTMANTALFAVYRLPPEQPSGQYSAVLVDQDEARLGYAWEAIIKDGRIVALLFSCAASPQELVELRGYTDAVVPPQAP